MAVYLFLIISTILDNFILLFSIVYGTLLVEYEGLFISLNKFDTLIICSFVDSCLKNARSTPLYTILRFLCNG